jgi:hypothetical protein
VQAELHEELERAEGLLEELEDTREALERLAVEHSELAEQCEAAEIQRDGAVEREAVLRRSLHNAETAHTVEARRLNEVRPGLTRCSLVSCALGLDACLMVTEQGCW